MASFGGEASRSTSGATAARTTSCRRVEAAVEVDGGDQRFAGIAEQTGVASAAGVFLATRKPEAGRQAELVRDLHQRFAADQRGVPARQRADFLAAEIVEQQIGDHQPEHAVAEELHSFVAVPAPSAPRPGSSEWVSASSSSGRTLEVIAQPILQRRASAGVISGLDRPRHSMLWNNRSKRTVRYHCQNFSASPSTEKKMTCALPIRFSNGT